MRRTTKVGLSAIGCCLISSGWLVVGAQPASTTTNSEAKRSDLQPVGTVRSSEPGKRTTSRAIAKSRAGKQGYHHDFGAGLSATEAKPAAALAIDKAFKTRIVPNRESTDGRLRLETEFASLLSKADPNPRSRSAHFEWLARNQAYVNFGGQQVGWNGIIVASTYVPNKGYILKVRMSPVILPDVRSPILDYVDETYVYDEKKFMLIESDAAIAKPRLQNFPVFD